MVSSCLVSDWITEDAPELSKGVIGRHGSLRSFVSKETDSNVGFLDHSDVVGAVSDAEGHGVSSFLDQANGSSFLGRLWMRNG